jgi:hypothetical protein
MTGSTTTERAARRPQPATARHWLVALGATLLVTVGGATFLSFTFVNPGIAATLDVPLSSVMIYNSLIAIGGLPAMIVLAPWLLSGGSAVALVIYAAGACCSVCPVDQPPCSTSSGWACVSFGTGTQMMGSTSSPLVRGRAVPCCW